jgi:hypothetical protein
MKLCLVLITHIPSIIVMHIYFNTTVDVRFILRYCLLYSKLAKLLGAYVISKH